MYVDEPPMDGNIPGFNISKIDICPFGVYQRSFRLFQGDFSKDIHQRSRLLCFTQNDHTGQTEFKICPFLKWAQLIFPILRLMAQSYTDSPSYLSLLMLFYPFWCFSILFDAFLSLLMLFYPFWCFSIPFDAFLSLFDAFLPKKCVWKQVIWHQ
jgi:hypothetical protein